MKRRLALTAALLCSSTAPVRAQDDSAILQSRLEIREDAQDALSTLYEFQHAARYAIEHAAGCAVFSTFGVKLLSPAASWARGWSSITAPTARPS